MKTGCERPYQRMIAAAAALRHLRGESPARHVRHLATELANAVLDVDARMRAGLDPPRAWTPTTPARGQHGKPRR